MGGRPREIHSNHRYKGYQSHDQSRELYASEAPIGGLANVYQLGGQPPRERMNTEPEIRDAASNKKQMEANRRAEENRREREPNLKPLALEKKASLTSEIRNMIKPEAKPAAKGLPPQP